MMGAYDFMLYGVIIAEELFIALYFARFWRGTRDSLFLFLTAGFVVMAIHRFLLGYAKAHGIVLEQQTLFFIIRAASYLLILTGILHKNLGKKAAA
jgi:hypothetical protein